MFKKVISVLHNVTIRHYARVMAIVVVCGIVGITILYQIPREHVLYAPERTQEGLLESVPVSLYARSKPVRLIIPKISLDASFVLPLGLNADKTVSVPDSYTEVGWYTYGATPGEIGSSVILGHVDSKEGPAVFYSLGQLDKGDEVIVEREDGTSVTFVVESKERVLQEKFPTEKVYGKIEYAGLRLVTCTGLYDRGSFQYSHNLIVYARLKE